jgi:hydroxyacid-oxoacid transhydrogenase
LKDLGITSSVCIFTDKTVVNLSPFQRVVEALETTGIQFEVFDNVCCEPTDVSMQAAAEFCRGKNFEAFIAVGGGSVIDTCKAANLYMKHPDAHFLDFVNAPVGKGLNIYEKLAPCIAVPTTAGTGSETTGVAIFDHLETGAKTGIRLAHLISNPLTLSLTLAPIPQCNRLT